MKTTLNFEVVGWYTAVFPALKGLKQWIVSLRLAWAINEILTRFILAEGLGGSHCFMEGGTADPGVLEKHAQGQVTWPKNEQCPLVSVKFVRSTVTSD